MMYSFPQIRSFLRRVAEIFRGRASIRIVDAVDSEFDVYREFRRSFRAAKTFAIDVVELFR